MFIMDVPIIPAQETPIVLAQAATPGASANPQPDYILNTCSETESTGDPSSAMRTVDPAYMLKNYLYSSSNGKRIADLTSIKVTLVQDTSRGKITSVIDNTGRPWYAYDAEPDYVGNDRAVFLAEFEGKVYKIVLELHVFRGGAGRFWRIDLPRTQAHQGHQTLIWRGRWLRPVFRLRHFRRPCRRRQTKKGADLG